MAIRFEYGPPPSALGALAYQSGVQQAQDRRRRELEALQVQAAQMRQQRQQAALDRQFNSWKTQYGHHSAMARAKADYQWRDQSQQKEFVQQNKVNDFQEEARKRAARQANIVALAKQKRQYELANDNAAAGHTRTQISNQFDEQMEYYSPDGVAEATKIYRSHMKRRNEGKLSPDAIWKDELQMYDAINDLYHDPGMRSTKGKPGWKQTVVSKDGIYTENYTMPDGTTASRYAPHPQGGIHQTAIDLTELHDRDDRKRTWTVDKDLPTERTMYNKATVEVISSKDGSNQIKVSYQATELQDERKLALTREDTFSKQLAQTAPELTINNPKWNARDAKRDNYDVPKTLKVRRVRSKNRRQMLVDKYGPMRDFNAELHPGDPGFDPTNVHPLINHIDHKAAWEAELLRRNKQEINEAIGRDQKGGGRPQADPAAGLGDQVDQRDAADEAGDIMDPAEDPNLPPAHPEPDEPREGVRDFVANAQMLDNEDDRNWLMELARDPEGWQRRYPMQDAAGRPTEHARRKERVWGQLQRIQEGQREQVAEEKRVDQAALGRFHGWIDETMNDLRVQKNPQGESMLTPERAQRLEEAKNIRGMSLEELEKLRDELEAELNAARLLGQSAQAFRGIFA